MHSCQVLNIFKRRLPQNPPKPGVCRALIPLKSLSWTHQDSGVCRGQPGRSPALRGSREKVVCSEPLPKSRLLINQPQRFSVRGLAEKSKLHIFVTTDRRCARHPGGRDPGTGLRPSASRRASRDSSLQQAPSLRKQKATTSRPKERQPWPARRPAQRDSQPRASRGRAWGAGPALGVLCRHSPAADATGSPSLQWHSARRAPRSPLCLPPTLPTFHAAPRAGVGVPRVSARPRARPRAPAPSAHLPQWPAAPHLPARTCRGARSLVPGGGARAGSAPSPWQPLPAAPAQSSEGRSVDPRAVRRTPCWIDAALRRGPRPRNVLCAIT